MTFQSSDRVHKHVLYAYSSRICTWKHPGMTDLKVSMYIENAHVEMCYVTVWFVWFS